MADESHATTCCVVGAAAGDLRIPGLRNLPARVTAFGVRRTRLERPEETVPVR